MGNDGWQDVEQNPEGGWADVAPPQALQPSQSAWQRLKSGVMDAFHTQPTDPHILTEVQTANGEDPRTTSANEKRSEAGTLATIAAGLGRSSFGNPEPSFTGLARDVGSVASATGDAIADAAGSAKDAIGRGVRTPKGTLKPSVRTAARIAGGAAGSLAGTGGTIVGGLAGPTLADAVLPDHPNPAGWVAKLPTRMPRAAAPAEAVDSVAAAIKQGIASKISTRMPKPVSTPSTPPTIAGMSTSPESVATIPPAQLPAVAKGAMSSTGTMPAEPLGTPPPKTATPSIARASEPRFSGSEGRPATWTNETVKELATKGNRDAISQAIRRGLGLPPNARYVMGDADFPRAVLNPREVTKFSPEGTPLRNADNPLAQNPSSKARIAPGEISQMPPAPTQATVPEVHQQLAGHIAAIEKAVESGGAKQYDIDQLKTLLDKLKNGGKAQTKGFAGEGLGKPPKPE